MAGKPAILKRRAMKGLQSAKGRSEAKGRKSAKIRIKRATLRGSGGATKSPLELTPLNPPPRIHDAPRRGNVPMLPLDVIGTTDTKLYWCHKREAFTSVMKRGTGPQFLHYNKQRRMEYEI